MATQYCYVEPLGKKHNRAAFSCGKHSLDLYLREQARQDAQRHAAAPFVAVAQKGDPEILGYYALSAYAIELGTLPESTARKLPHYPVVPATLIGRFAIDLRQQGKGLGEFLLMDALRRAYEQSAQIAAAAVIVEAIDDSARAFYLHFDFIPFPNRDDKLFLTMRDIAPLFPA